MKRLVLLAALLLAVGGPADAQVRPQPGAGDPRLQTVEYREGDVVLLELAPGYQMTIELAQDEQIENVALGDSAAWQVTPNRRGDRLFLKALQAGMPTNMTVITSSRLYAMELSPLSGPTAEMAYVVRYSYPEAAQEAQEPEPVAVVGTYRLSGSRRLRPTSVVDDGVHTYIQWPRDVPLPAVYSVDEQGRESLINGMMRDDVFVIDEIVRRLVFRIDNATAGAVRRRQEAAR
jgi:type IV secretion system protein VirB9